MSQRLASNDIRSFLTWVAGGVLIFGGAILLAVQTGLVSLVAPPMLVIAGAVVLASLPFWVRWYTKGRETWALLAAWAFLSAGVLAAVTYLAPRQPQWIVMVGAVLVALPFVAAYLSNRRRWWLVIPAYSALVFAVLYALSRSDASVETVAGAGLVALALPFWGIYIFSRRSWWALALAASLSGVGALTLVFFTLLRPGSTSFYLALNILLAAASFSLWWVARDLRGRLGNSPITFDWALWLAVGFAGAAILSLRSPSAANWGIIALLLGVYIVFQQIRQRRSAPTVKVSQPKPSPASPGSNPPPPPSASASGSGPGVQFRPLDLTGKNNPDEP